MFIYQVYANIKNGRMGVRNHQVKKETNTRYYDISNSILKKEDMNKVIFVFNDVTILTDEKGLKNAISQLVEVLENQLHVLEDMYTRSRAIDDSVIAKIKKSNTSDESSTQEKIAVTEDML